MPLSERGMAMVRRAASEDGGAICTISREDLGYDCDPVLVRSRIEQLDSEREAVFVAETDGAVAGYIHAEIYQTLYFETMVNILGLAVSGAFRRRGIGRQLMKAAENWAAEKGIRYIRLNSGGSRTDAHAFYRAIGFDEEKDQKRFLKVLER